MAEHLVFGYSEGHYSDMNKVRFYIFPITDTVSGLLNCYICIMEQLDKVFQWLGYNKREASSQVKWAALNTVFISHHHTQARSRLAEAMALGKSIGFCIDTMENALSRKLI